MGSMGKPTHGRSHGSASSRERSCFPIDPHSGGFAAHIASLGIRVGMADHLVSESLYLRDPDGLGIEVYADRPRSTWRRNGRELAMATIRSNIDKVIAGASDAAWDGAPPATTMAPLHLHVGSLESCCPRAPTSQQNQRRYDWPARLPVVSDNETVAPCSPPWTP